jgi:ABC-2 type transport system ATP-binding protein
MDEADRLSDRIGIMDYGRIVALDTPHNLKASIGPEATLEDTFIKLTGAKIRDEPVKNNHTDIRGPHFGGRF